MSRVPPRFYSMAGAARSTLFQLATRHRHRRRCRPPGRRRDATRWRRTARCGSSPRWLRAGGRRDAGDVPAPRPGTRSERTPRPVSRIRPDRAGSPDRSTSPGCLGSLHGHRAGPRCGGRSHPARLRLGRGRTTGWSSSGTTGRRTSARRRRRCSRSPTRLGIRWISYDRPGYGGSTPRPGATWRRPPVTSPAVADALGIEPVRGDGALRRRAPRPGLRRPAPRTGCWRSSAWRGWRRSAPPGSTGSPGWRRPARRRCGPRPPAARPRSATRRQATTYDPGFAPADIAALPGDVGVVHAGRPAGASPPGRRR